MRAIRPFSARIRPSSMAAPEPTGGTDTPRTPRQPSMLSASIRSLNERERLKGLQASLRHVNGSEAFKAGKEEVLGAWATVMLDTLNVSRDRYLVLTNAALYRLQWLPDHGFINKCRRMPLESIVRVYKSNGWLTLCESVEQRGVYLKLQLALTKHEPPDARPWRQGAHTMNTRWYRPQEHAADPDELKLDEIVAAVRLAAPQALATPPPTPGGFSSDDKSDSSGGGFSQGSAPDDSRPQTAATNCSTSTSLDECVSDSLSVCGGRPLPPRRWPRGARDACAALPSLGR
eukprot:1025582-Prymnesium_polylepis.1